MRESVQVRWILHLCFLLAQFSGNDGTSYTHLYKANFASELCIDPNNKFPC